MIGAGRQRQFSVGSINVALAVSRRLPTISDEPESPASVEAGRPWRVPELLDHPDGYMRHRRVCAAIRSSSRSGTILDVGDPFCQLADWLPEFSVTATDLLSAPAATSKGKAFVQADFTRAGRAFADKSFDIVASTDVLEHVRAADRYDFVKSCARIARKAIYLAFPAGHAAGEAEDLVRRSRSKSVFSESLREHASMGLPDLPDIVQAVQQLGLRSEVRTLTTIFEWLSSFVFGPDDGDRQLIRDYRSFIKKTATDEAGPGAAYRYLVIARW